MYSPRTITIPVKACQDVPHCSGTVVVRRVKGIDGLQIMLIVISVELKHRQEQIGRADTQASQNGMCRLLIHGQHPANSFDVLYARPM